VQEIETVPVLNLAAQSWHIFFALASPSILHMTGGYASGLFSWQKKSAANRRTSFDQ